MTLHSSDELTRGSCVDISIGAEEGGGEEEEERFAIRRRRRRTAYLQYSGHLGRSA